MRADNRTLQSGSCLGEDAIERFADRYDRSSPGLRLNLDERARKQVYKCFFESRDERQQVGKFVRPRIEHDNGDRQCAKVLLILKVLVDRDERVEVVRGASEQLTVLDAAQSHLDHCAYGMRR